MCVKAKFCLFCDIHLYNNRLKHSKEELKKKQADMKKTDRNYKQDKATYDAAKKNMHTIEVRYR